jgi:hypothetical protein
MEDLLEGLEHRGCSVQDWGMQADFLEKKAQDFIGIVRISRNLVFDRANGINGL